MIPHMDSTMQAQARQTMAGYGSAELHDHTSPVINNLDNTDEMEPGQAKINQQVQIQQRNLLQNR